MSVEAGRDRGVSRRKQLFADSALALVTLIWGSTFVLVKDMVAQTSPLLFLAMRFTFGALALGVVMLAGNRWRGLTMRELVWGAGIGVTLWAGYAFQTIGLQWTTASNAAFITGLYVALVPLIGIPIVRQVPDRWAWTGIVLATAGMAILTLRFENGLRINSGDLVVLGCTFAFAVQVVLIARVSKWCDPIRITMVQVLVTALLNALGALIFEHPAPGLGLDIWASAAFLGIAATAAALAIQVAVQSFTTVVHTALIFALEPVFGALFAVIFAAETMEGISLFGAALILAGMLLAELGPRLRRSGIVEPPEATIPEPHP